MVEVHVTSDISYQAKKKSYEMGSLHNSIRKGDGNYVGFVGELVVAEYLNCQICNTYDYDLIHRSVTLDVKTKECTSPPKQHYECSVAEYNTKQKCKAYVFVRVCKDTAWILGWIPKEKYFERASFLKKGEIDPSNNYVVKANCYNLPISKLNSIDVIK